MNGDINMNDNDKYHLTLILLALIVFSAFGYYMGSRNDATTPNISNQIGEPDYINLANSGKGVPSDGSSTKKSNKTNHTKNNTTTV